MAWIYVVMDQEKRQKKMGFSKQEVDVLLDDSCERTWAIPEVEGQLQFGWFQARILPSAHHCEIHFFLEPYQPTLPLFAANIKNYWVGLKEHFFGME